MNLKSESPAGGEVAAQPSAEGKWMPKEPTPEMLYAMAECDGYKQGDRDHPMLTQWEDYWHMAYEAAPQSVSPPPTAPTTGEAVFRNALELIRDWPLRDSKMESAQMRKLAHDTLNALATPKATAPAAGEAKWKAAYEEEARKFQQETLRTSELHQMLSKLVEMHYPRHSPGPWSKGCWQCELIGKAQELLDKPVNAATLGPASASTGAVSEFDIEQIVDVAMLGDRGNRRDLFNRIKEILEGRAV